MAVTFRIEPFKAELRYGIVDALVMAKRNLLRYRRSTDLLIFSTIQPVMFVLMFAFVFGGAIDTPGGSYVNFLLPGIMVLSVLFGSTQTGIGLAEDVASGQVDRYRSLPMARSAVVAGRILADTARNTFVVTVMLTVGYAIGFRFNGTVLGAIATVAVAVAMGHAFSWIPASIGTSVKTAQTAEAAGVVWIFPLVFLSSVFVPLETMPDWLQVFAANNPVTVTANALRGLSQGGEFWEPLWKTAAWWTGIMAVFVPVAIWRYHSLR